MDPHSGGQPPMGPPPGGMPHGGMPPGGMPHGGMPPGGPGGPYGAGPYGGDPYGGAPGPGYGGDPYGGQYAGGQYGPPTPPPSKGGGPWLWISLGCGGLFVIGVALVTWRHWLPLLAAVGFGAATFGAYLMSMTVGFFGVREQVWTTEAVISAVTEVAAVVLGVAALVVERRRA